MTKDQALIAFRALHFAAILVVAGTVTYMALVAVPAARPVPTHFGRLRRLAALLVLGALALAVLSGAGWLTVLSAEILDVSPVDAVAGGGIYTVFTETRFGWLMAAQLALALALVPLVLSGRLAIMQVVFAAAFLALVAFGGHAGAVPGPQGDLHLASDLAHLLAAGAWLGGLPAFIFALAAARREDTPPWHDFVIGMTQRFSVLGLACVAVLFASGLINSWYLLGGFRDLWTTTYGELIALKIVLFALMVLVAACNKFWLTPRLPEKAALYGLKRAVVVEIGLGLCVLAAVAAVGTMQPTAHVHPQPLDIPSDAAFVHIHDPEAMADVTIEPGHVGSARASIRVSREDFSPYPAKAVKLSLEPPRPAGGGIDRTAVEHDGAWSVNDFELDRSGNWTVRVTIIKRSGETITLDAPVVIER